jgi:hypothetical protein
MYRCSRANRGRPAGIFLGCFLTALPLVSTAQVVGANVQVAAASSTGSQPNAQIVRDRWDASKVDTAATDGNPSAVRAPSVAPAGSQEFAQQYVAHKLKLWQERLKLSDWRITWAMAHRSDLKPNTVGQIHWNKPSRSASILVLDPSEYRMPINAMLDDMELTIVHELVHLKLTSLPHSEASRGSEEQAVNGISEALCALEHQRNN